MGMTLPLAKTIENFCVALAAAQGVRWAEVSAETARHTRAGVSAGLMSMRGEAAPIGTAAALEAMENASRDLRAIGMEIADSASETAIQRLYAIALILDGLRAATRPVDAEAI